MLIFDGDYPMAHAALGLNRDLTLPLDELRAVDANPSNIPFGCLPEMRRGGVYCALMKIAARRNWRRHRRPRGDRRGSARDRQHRRLREARPDSRAPRLRQ